MLKFCTLFNTTYLSRGLAMYHSLEQHCRDFHLYILAFDSHCFDLLTHMQLQNASIIRLDKFENEKLLSVKGGRTAGEYCWTCASSSIKYCIETFDLDHCTYVDADLLFFSDPAVLVEEMGDKSVLITPHRYTPCHDQSATSGVYCVQFMTFKNTAEGMHTLNWWVEACLKWCFNRCEDNKFGDQKYLDDWTERFSGVHVLQHLGGGVAPWNIQQYSFDGKSNDIMIKDLSTNMTAKLVFYHYHGFGYCSNNIYKLSPENYSIGKTEVRKIYKPYVTALSAAENRIAEIRTNLVPHELTNEMDKIKRVVGRSVLFFLKGYYKNIYAKHFFQYGIFN